MHNNNCSGIAAMNNSFLRDDIELPLFSRRDLVIIFVAGGVSASLGLFLTIPVNPNFALAPLLDSVYIVSMTFATGLFSFLTAGLLFSSRASRSYLLRRFEQVGVKRAYLIRTLHTFVITSVFSIIITIIAFLTPNYYPVGTNYFVFLPSVLGASLVVSICLASIAIALATITDDSRLCIVLGCVSTFLIATVAGGIPEHISFRYSLTRNIALLSPHNIVRALAVQFSGHQFESTDDMVGYLGFAVSAEGLAVALLILILISFVLLLVGQRALTKNSTRWPVLKGMISIDEKWDASVSAEELQTIKRIRRGLRLQRGLTTIIVGVLIVSMVGGVSMYSTYITNTTTFIHYETSGTSENVQLGSWNIFDVDVSPPYPGLFNVLRFRWHIITLGNASGTVTIFTGIIGMNSTEFNLLDETSRLELVRDRIDQSSGSGGGIGTNLEESYGSYICVMKIVSYANPSENGYVVADLLIIQEAL